ncbi:MAG: outer membrane protein assembly factor BamD [Azoarcus sp.]|jgi:outer membrane protein assembly factor BamD|nr:outer membrane protein assembly factor BamD [Azoarcus sp.]
MILALRSVIGKRVRFAATVAALVLALPGCSSTPDDKTAGWDAQKIYSEAKSNMASGAYEEAIKLFEKLEARFPYGRYAQQAQLDTAYAYYKSGEPELAIVSIDRFIKLHPNHSDVDYAYYLKGLVNFNEDLGVLGDVISKDLTQRDPRAAREAFDAFRDLVERFPNSKYVTDARQRMQYLINSLAAYEIHVAHYYFNRGAFIAAANRAQSAITNYPNSPAQEEALSLLIQSYSKLEMTDLRDDAERILRQNFPNSKYLK